MHVLIEFAFTVNLSPVAVEIKTTSAFRLSPGSNQRLYILLRWSQHSVVYHEAVLQNEGDQVSAFKWM